MTSPRLIALALLVLLPNGASSRAAGRPAPDEPVAASLSIPVDDDARAEARWIFATRCARCHGPAGRGDGEGAQGLDPAPSDLTDPGGPTRHGRGFLETIILGGGRAVGRSSLMPGNPDLKAKPEVIVALRDLVSALGAARDEL